MTGRGGGKLDRCQLRLFVRWANIKYGNNDHSQSQIHLCKSGLESHHL